MGKTLEYIETEIKDATEMVAHFRRQEELADIKIGYQQHLDYQTEVALKKQQAEEKQSKKQAKIQADLKAENDRINAELKAKQDEELRIKKESEAKEKALLNAGDQEKVKAFFEEYTALIERFPMLSTEEGKAMRSRVLEGLGMVKKLIISDSKTLL